MRHNRVRPDWQDTWHHAYNRTVGNSEDRPMERQDKEKFVRILRRVSKLYTVRVVAYQFMSNHFHLLLYAPKDLPTEEETCRRYEAFHYGKRQLTPGTPACQEWQTRLRDVSWFMRHLQHLYTAWYNRTRPIRRRGPLWADRFKNTILQPGSALWACWTYIEYNPVRAGMVANVADYRFCSYGAWVQSGRHPFAEDAMKYLLPALPKNMTRLSLSAVKTRLRKKFAEISAEEQHKKVEEPGALQSLSLTATRRVRYWTDGLVIGTSLFVRDVMRRVRPADAVDKHRLAKSDSAAEAEAERVCAWRQLRVIQT